MPPTPQFQAEQSNLCSQAVSQHVVLILKPDMPTLRVGKRPSVGARPIHSFFPPCPFVFPRHGSFTYTVSDGSVSAKAGTVYLVSGGGLLEAEEFDFGVGAWKV